MCVYMNVCASTNNVAQWQELRVESAPSDAYTLIEAAAPLRVHKTLAMSALHAYIRLDSIEAKKIRLAIGSGSLDFQLDGRHAAYDYVSPSALLVQTKSAPVTIKASIPIDLTLDYPVRTPTHLSLCPCILTPLPMCPCILARLPMCPCTVACECIGLYVDCNASIGARGGGA